MLVVVFVLAMRSGVIWRLLGGGGIVGAVAASGMALAVAQPSSPHREPRLSGRRIPRVAEKAAAVTSGRLRYAVEIQAGYDRRGNPSLVANFVPDGDLAKPRWAVCRPPHVSRCMAVKNKGQLVQPGATSPGTVFRAIATYRGRTFTARSAVWTGSVHPIRPPGLRGYPRVGARVRPEPALWRGGWKAVAGYRPRLGMFSGGKRPSFESLSIETCRTASGVQCVNQTPQGKLLDFAQQPVTIPRRFVGWYLFAFDEHYPADTAWAEPGYSNPFAIPPLKIGATIARSRPVGPIRG